jgi:Nitrile hydratase, alpha chain
MGAGLRATATLLRVGDTAKGERIMTEASDGGRRSEIERTLVQRSREDENFRQRLLDDPRAAVEQELGIQVPENMEVRVVEESADTIYLVLPSASPLGEGGEISDQELKEVAGGGGTNIWTDFEGGVGTNRGTI